MNIFVTGASGFVGGAITESLAKDHRVLAMARSDKSARVIDSLGAHSVMGDLESVEAEQLSGVDVVIHCAARAEDWGKYEWFYRANVSGTQALLRAAQAAGVKRFIHMGTEAAVFTGTHLNNIDESVPLAIDSPYPYSRTKALAEQAVLSANTNDFVTLSLRPRLVWGPGDQSVLPTILEMIEKGAFAWIDEGRFLTSTTYIGNLVEAVRLALVNGSGGEAYFITDGENNTLRQFFSRLISFSGVEVPDKNAPAWLVRASALVVDGLWRVLRLDSKPPISRMAAAMMSSNCTLNTAKAEKGLGYRPVLSVDQGLALLEASFKPS